MLSSVTAPRTWRITASVTPPVTPKDDINGSQVGQVYWEENDLERIKTYCQKDVVAIVQLMRRYNYQPLILEDCIDYTN